MCQNMSNKSVDNVKSSGWRKNLYSNVGYDDNYTDVTFLDALRTNVNQKKFAFRATFVGAGLVTEQVCLVFNFVVIYRLLVEDVYQAKTILINSSIVTGLCYLYYLSMKPEKGYKLVFLSHMKTVVIFCVLGFILSPVLKTLTETISSDTIDATTFLMMLLHIIFFDYKTSAALPSRALSLNAAIFGSLCLASRLPTSFHAFVLLTVSVECFVLYPPFAYSIRSEISVTYIVFIVLLTSLLNFFVSKLMCTLFICIGVFLNLLCPFLYVYLQKHKNNIHGPWDEAIINSSNKNKNT